MQRQRINQYNSLFLGAIGSNASIALRQKSYRSQVARMSFLSPPEIYHFANHISQGPRSFHMPVPVHQKPQQLTARMHTRYVQGTALYNQAITAQITQLGRMVQ
jgi:hypothetical protein